MAAFFFAVVSQISPMCIFIILLANSITIRLTALIIIVLFAVLFLAIILVIYTIHARHT